MSTTDKPQPKFAVGSNVRVKKGVNAPHYPDMPMGGWRGKVYQASGTVYFVHWSGATLQAMHSIHRERRQGDSIDCRDMWLEEGLLEADPGEPLRVEQTEHKSVPVSQVQSGSIKHESLSPEQEKYAQQIYESCGHLICPTFEQWKLAFLQGSHPAQELLIWCVIAQTYERLCSLYPELGRRRLLCQIVICSMGGTLTE